jgi:hypothetical protein
MGNYFVLEKPSWRAEGKESEKRQYLASLFFPRKELPSMDGSDDAVAVS